MLNIPENRRVHVGAGAWVVIVLAVGILLWGNRTPDFDAANRHRMNALGQVLAEETAKLIKPGSTVVVVRTDPKITPSRELAEACEAVKEELADRKIPTLVELVGIGLSAEEWVALFQKHSTAGALVSFVGCPPSVVAESAQIPDVRPCLVVANASVADAQQLCNQRFVQFAVVVRDTAGKPQPKTPREIFDETYQGLTPPARSAP